MDFNDENEKYRRITRSDGSLPSYEAYGRATGGIPSAEAYRLARKKLEKEKEKEKEKEQQQSPIQQIIGGAMDMASEYFKMKNHGYKNLDDYHHCKANFNAAARGPYGYNTAKTLGDAKEQFDFYWNQAYKGLSKDDAQRDRFHDLGVNANGRLRGNSGLYNSAQDACADYLMQNPAFPKKYW